MDSEFLICPYNTTINHYPPTRSQMISQEDFSVISRLDSGDQASRDKVQKNVTLQCLLSLLKLLFL